MGRAILGGVGILLILAVGFGAYMAGLSIEGRPHTTAAVRPPTTRLAGPPPAVADAGSPEDAADAMTLAVVSEPAGALVAVDGLETGNSTPTTVQIPPHRTQVWVRVSRAGFLPEERAVESTAGEARFVLMPIVQDGGAPTSVDGIQHRHPADRPWHGRR